jgi:hypothetical protein
MAQVTACAASRGGSSMRVPSLVVAASITSADASPGAIYD